MSCNLQNLQLIVLLIFQMNYKQGSQKILLLFHLHPRLFSNEIQMEKCHHPHHNQDLPN